MAFIKFKDKVRKFTQMVNEDYILKEFTKMSPDFNRNEQFVMSWLPFTVAYEWDCETRKLDVILSDTYDYDGKEGLENTNFLTNWKTVVLPANGKMTKFFNNFY